MMPSSKTEGIRVWLCDCGRVHLETKHDRQSFTPAEFIALVRRTAGVDGAGLSPPGRPHLLDGGHPKPLLRAVPKSPAARPARESAVVASGNHN
jgi:hypothetical protein